MAWDKDRPKGSQAASLVDDTTSENFDWLEQTLQVDGVFPGTANSRGRRKVSGVTVAAMDALADKVNGQLVYVNNLGGGSQVDGDGVSTHFWPHRYSAAGGGGELADHVPLTPPVFDDQADEDVAAALLGANDFGLLAFRQRGNVFVPRMWNGTAFVDAGGLGAGEVLVHQAFVAFASLSNKSINESALDDGSATDVTTWTQVTGYSLAWTVPALNGTTFRVELKAIATAHRNAGTSQTLRAALTYDLDGVEASLDYLEGWDYQQNSIVDARRSLESIFEVSGTGATQALTLRLRAQKTSSGSNIVTFNETDAASGVNLDTRGLFAVRVYAILDT